MADNTESIGGVSVSITGDASGLGPAFTAAQSQAQSAGTAIASSFNAGAAGADQITAAVERLTVALREESAASSLAAQRNAAMGRSLQQVGQHAQTGGFSLRYMFLGLKDIAEGRGTFAVSELANQLVRLGPLALAAGGALAALGGAGYAIFTLVERTRLEAELAGKLAIAFRESNAPLVTINDSLDLANDKLANDIAKIEKKPENGIKEAIDEAKLSADRLGESLVSDLDKLKEVLSKNAPSWYRLLTPSAGSDQQKRITQVQAQVGADTGLPAAQLQDYQFGLDQITKKLLEISVIRNRSLPGQGLVNFGPEIQQLQQEATVYQAEIDRINKEQQSTALTGKKYAADASAESQRLAERAEDQARQALHKRIEIFETEKREAAELQAAKERGQDELNRAAQQLYDTNKRAAEEADNAARKMALSSNELANKSSQLLSGVKPDNGEKNEAVNQPALQRLQGGNAVQQQLALAIQLKQVGIDTNNEIQSRIGNLQQELAAAQKTNVPIETRLKLEQEILQAKIAQAAANGQGDQTDKLAAAQNQIQQTLVQWKSLNFGDIAQSSTKAVIAGVDGISQAMARAIVQGKNFGQAVTQSLKQIGTSILASAIETGLKRILSSLLGLVPGFQAVSGAQAGAAAQQKAIASASVLTAAGEAAAWGFESVMAALPFPINVTVAPEVATAAFAQTSAFGAFAGGTDSAPGGFAMVGEKGPEIMYVPRGAQITPNHKIGSYAGGTSGARSFSSSSSTSIGELHVHAHGVGNPDAFAKAAVAAIPREIKRQTSKASPYSN